MVTSATENFVILTGLARLRLSPSVTDPPLAGETPSVSRGSTNRSRWRGSRYLPQQPTTERKGFHARKRNKRNVLDFLRLAPGPMGPPAQMAGVCPARRDSKRLRGACPARRTSASPLAGSRHSGRCGVPEAACSARAPIRTWPAMASLREKWT